MNCPARTLGAKSLLHWLIGIGLIGLLLTAGAACSPPAAVNTPTPQVEPRAAGLKFYEFYSPL